MLQFLPYALAAYGGYKGYKANKDAGASGINRILGGVTGATLGYFGGKAGLSGGAKIGLPGFAAGQAQFTPITSASFMPAQITEAFKERAAKKILEDETKKRNILDFFTRQRVEDGVIIPGEREIDPMKAGIGAGALAYLTGAFKQKPVDLFTPSYNLNYGEFARKSPDMKFIDPVTGEDITS